MDVLALVQRLDDLVDDARAVPMTDQARVDRDEISQLIDEMRATIPEEIKQARWIVKERQEMLAEASREAERILADTRAEAARLTSPVEVAKIAERQSEEIVQRAGAEARELREAIDEWAESMLATLDLNLVKFQGAVRRGRERLRDRSSSEAVLR